MTVVNMNRPRGERLVRLGLGAPQIDVDGVAKRFAAPCCARHDPRVVAAELDDQGRMPGRLAALLLFSTNTFAPARAFTTITTRPRPLECLGLEHRIKVC